MAHEVQKKAFAEGASIEVLDCEGWLLTTRPDWAVDKDYRIVLDCEWALNAVKDRYKAWANRVDDPSRKPLEMFLRMTDQRGR